MNFKKPLMMLIGAAVVLTSCESEEYTGETVDTSDLEVSVTEDTNPTFTGNVFTVVDNNLRERVTDKATLDLVASLELDNGRVTKGLFHYPDGSTEEKIYIGDDVVASVTELQELKKLMDTAGESKQYRTFNLVTGNSRTIDILGYTGGQFALSSKARTALGWAVNNYNRLSGVTLNFRLTFGTNFSNSDMVVYDNSANNSGQGGVAGFPSNQGRPNKFVQIYNIEQFSTNVNEHVITHEIGHSIGFRHSDWFDRLSCPPGFQGNEQSGSDGAINVAGTPTGRDLTSVMQACFATNEDGEFNNNDITALRNMY